MDAVWFDFASLGLLVLTGGAAVSCIGYDEARFFVNLDTVLSERQDHTPSWALYPGSGLF